MPEFTIGNYLATRLEQIGIKHYFMVPGDYNLVLLDQLLANKNMEQIGCFLAGLAKNVHGNDATLTQYHRIAPAPAELAARNGDASAQLTQAELWHQIEQDLDPKSTLLCEGGDSSATPSSAPSTGFASTGRSPPGTTSATSSTGELSTSPGSGSDSAAPSHDLRDTP